MNRIAILPSCYLPPVLYLSVMQHYETIVIDIYEHYIKQTYRNRCVISSSLGKQSLTVPVVKAEGSSVMADMRISDHGNWCHMHLSALDSSYMNSPFYEYYRDDFLSFYENKYDYLVDYNTRLLKTVCELMDIPCKVEFSTSYIDAADGYDDFRPLMTQKKGADGISSAFHFKPYYQVFSSRHGFMENLSCVDLLFNMGPESCLFL